jgi:Cof subfamily protein (haloacid dehalogenase superfamily)
MFNTEIRMIACDMDGTLIGSAGKISPETQEYIRKVIDAGYIFSIASGRMVHRIEKHVKNFLSIKNKHYVAANGAVILESGKIVYEKTFPVRPYRDLILRYLDLGLEIDFDYDDAYRPLIASRRMLNQVSDVHGYDSPLGTGDEVWDLKINKLSVMDPKDDGTLNGFISGLNEIGGCTAFQYGTHAAEIAPEGSSKLSGIKYLANYLGLSLDNVLAIGDHTNDREMLTSCGFSAAVGNAVEEIRGIADYQCAKGYGLGVIEAIVHYTGVQ